MEHSDKDRLTTLEVKLEALTERSQATGAKVDALYDLFMQAKGAKTTMWVLFALSAVLGAKFLGFFGIAAEKFLKIPS